MSGLLQENQKVLLKKDNCFKIVTISDKTIDLDRVRFSLRGLIGCSFGASFSVENGQLVRLVDKSKFENYERIKVETLTSDDKSDNIDVNDSRDNRNMNLNSRTQLMSATDIEELKKSGQSGQTILDKLIENSTSFSQKTTFAQEKYLTKKKRRYMPVVSVHRITTRMLCDMYAARSKLKIMNLRVDTVAQIAAYANVQHGSRVLLVEMCAGLLLGALLEKGARVINFYHGSAPVLPECYSDWRQLDGRVYNLPLGQLVPLVVKGDFVTHFSAATSGPRDTPVAAASDHGNNHSKRVRLSPEALAEKREESDRRRKEARDFLLGDGASSNDCVIVAIRQRPGELTRRLLELLAPGKPLVVYSQFLEPLVELYDELRRGRYRSTVSSLAITESWLRNYQVLPERTHPEMSMSGTGGYLLTGIKLCSDEPSPNDVAMDTATVTTTDSIVDDNNK